MKKIEKMESPRSFEKFIKTKGTNYKELSKNENISIREELRERLLAEQGHICCYCGREIEKEHSIIEHFKPRDSFPKLQLDYQNLLLSCDGGQNARSKNKSDPPYCDSAKGNKEINISPLQKDCETRFVCDESGEIMAAVSSDEDANETITVLNLNNPVLVNQRKAAIATFAYYDLDWDWEEELGLLDQLCEGKFQQFCWAMKSYILHCQLDPVENKELLGV